MQVHTIRRSTLLTVLVTLILAGVMALVPAVATAQAGEPHPPIKPLPTPPPPKPTGLVALIANDPDAELDIEPFLNPYISGVAFQIHWNDIEKVEGKPKWSRLTEVFTAAQATGKWVQLLIFPGFFTPDWALKDVEADWFPLEYGPGKKTNTFGMLPMPWDSKYLSRWYNFLWQLSQQFGGYPEFKMIAAAGPTSVSDEFTEPEDNQQVKMPVVGGGSEYCSDIERWQRHGYRPSMYIDAWKEVLCKYSEYFPNQYISLSHGNGVAIKEDGSYDTTNQTNTDTTQSIVDKAIDILWPLFSFQSSALKGDPDYHSDAIQMVVHYNGRTVTGFQLGGPCTAKNPGLQGGASNDTPASALWASLINGMQLNDLGYHADYIEIHAIDVNNLDLQYILRWAASFYW